MAILKKNKGRKSKKEKELEKEQKEQIEQNEETSTKMKVDEFDLNDIVLSDIRIILHLPLSVLDTDNQIITNNYNQTNTNEPMPFYPDTSNYSSINSSNNLENEGKIFINTSNIQHMSTNMYDLNNNNSQNLQNLQVNNNSKETNTINELEEINKKRKEELNTKHITNDKHMPLFIDFIDSHKNNKWPKKTNIDCLWCCHSFNNTPVGIPIKKEDNAYTMFGCFCSPNCAAAYNFDSKYTSNEIWERYSLLNILYGSMEEPIKIAPPRLSLKKFGGKFTIEEFRESCKNKNYDYELIMPPLRSIIPTLEEVNIDADENHIVTTDNNDILLQRKSQQLRLKRTKPLPNSQNTLETCMKLRYLN